jgi:hypothetical protein
MDNEKIIFGVLCLISAVVLMYFIKKNIEPFATPVDMLKPPTRAEMNNFRIHNHYRIPVDVVVIPQDLSVKKGEEYEKGIKIAESLPTTLVGQMGNVISNGYNYFARGTVVLVYTSKDRKLIGKAVMNVPVGKTIRALHLGMSTGQDDLSMKGDPIRSPLGGSALPRLKIINASPRTLKLSTVASLNDGTLEPDIIIKPYDSVMYFGQYWKGIPLGVVFRDIDGYLNDFKLQYPITDLFMGLISDIHELPYGQAKFGGEFDDTVNTVAYPLQLTSMGQHKGRLINRSYIPTSW